MSAKPQAQHAESTKAAPIAGELFLRALAEHGVDYFFANPGTDFPPIVEAYSRAREGTNVKVPRPLVIPHENVAVAMAHGAFLMTGRPQAVMVHVNVGTGNTINNLTNASRDRVPMFLAAGRTPVTESGKFGSRNRSIHWAQEMFDQAGMVRELVKWDYELRVPEQVTNVVARAYEAAMTSPMGPVYMILPREPLSAPVDEPVGSAGPRAVPAPPQPDPKAIETLAGWIAAAENPLIITANSGRDPRALEALARLAERWGIAVATQTPRYLCLPTGHPMHMGFATGPLVGEADLIVVLEHDVPWMPSSEQPKAGTRVAHIGEDPAYLRYPMRSFPSDLSITAGSAAALVALDAALERAKADRGKIEARTKRIAERAKARRQKLKKQAEPGERITKPYLSKCMADAIGADAILVSEYWTDLEHCPREKPGTFFGTSPAGGLGWGFGCALGIKLAAPERFVCAALGDGSYIFNNPTACHWVADAQKLPVLTIIANNSRYGAVRGATLSMFQDGAAGRDDGRFLADLSPSPAYEKIVEAHGGHGERVERPADLPGALARAREAVLGGKQALLNVICPY
jgi:acetolactate synthase-1/2/3 large subunit